MKDGNTYFGNPNTGFVGDMYVLKNPGYEVYHGPVFDLAKRYLGGRAVDLTGKGFAAVEAQIKKSKPVWVIVTRWFRAVPCRRANGKRGRRRPGKFA